MLLKYPVKWLVFAPVSSSWVDDVICLVPVETSKQHLLGASSHGWPLEREAISVRTERRLALCEISFWRHGFGYGHESYLLKRREYWIDSHLYSFYFSWSPFCHAARGNEDVWQLKCKNVSSCSQANVIEIFKKIYTFFGLICNTESTGKWSSVSSGE